MNILMKHAETVNDLITLSVTLYKTQILMSHHLLHLSL